LDPLGGAKIILSNSQPVEGKIVIYYGNHRHIMPLTGRAVIYRKRLVEESKAIDMTFLRGLGFFRHAPGTVCTSKWTCRGEPWGTVCYWREDYCGEPLLLWFSYNIRRESDEWRPLKYGVEIDSTECHFGGRRYWFVCPLIVNGRACRRRCRAIYLGDSGYFGCRECQRLTYVSRRCHRDMVWELSHKYDDYLERVHKYRTPRGSKAKERRRRKLALVERQMIDGERLLDLRISAMIRKSY
jgi:hypothetical protein